MLNFMTVSGYIFWLLSSIGVVAWLCCVAFEKYKDIKYESSKRIEESARRDVGRAIYSSAYWLSGDEYAHIHPYVAMKVIGAHVRDHGWPDMQDIRSKLEQKNKEYLDGRTIE